MFQNQENIFSPGVKAMFLSTLFFAAANVFVKQVSHLPVMEIVFFRCLLGVVFCFVGLRRSGGDWRGNNHTLLLLRGLFGTTALYAFFLTVKNIPLASAMTIQYLSPIFTTLIAIFLLKEPIKRLQIVFYALAFAGVLMIEQFDARVSPLYLAIGAFSAFCSGMAYNLVRNLRGREHPLTVVLHFQLTGLIAGFIFCLYDWKTPSGWDWLFLILIGITSQLGQIFLTRALQNEKAASVAIVNYTGLIYGLGAGWFWFGETQPRECVVGMLLVIAGVLMSVVYTRRQKEIEKIEATAG